MYFFIDPDKITLQTIDEAYGPALAQPSPSPDNIYNTTSRFQLTQEAKAFACEIGSMIVQQSYDDDSLVNILVKPDKAITSVPVDVEYYIYRGILKNSLIVDDGNDCIVQGYNATTSNDVIKRIRLDSAIDDFTCKQIGYSNSISDAQKLDKILNFKNNDVNPVLVKEGDWIGTFTKDFKIGFEIVLKSDRANFDLGFLRAATNEVNVSGSLSPFEIRKKREEILGFIDPAAFYGMHHTKFVKYYEAGADNNTKKTTENSSGTGSDRFIYTKLLDKFFTKNKVYVDIRSEKGYSYNFYQNYKVSNTDLNNVLINGAPGAVALTNQNDGRVYETFQWPILILESSHPTGNDNKLRIKLRIGEFDNPKPILYTKTELGKTKFNGEPIDTSRYINTSQLVGNGTAPNLIDWTNEFRILFPNTQYGNPDSPSNRNYISNYARLHYFRSQPSALNMMNPPNVNPSVLENVHYYDSAFCSIDIAAFSIADLQDVGWVESANPIYIKEPLHNASPPYDIDGTGNFELNMINGAYWGDGKVLMYAKIENENPAKVSEKEYLNTYDQDLSSFKSSLYQKGIGSRLKFIVREYGINGNIGQTKIPGINFFQSNDLGGVRKNAGKNHKENCMLLGLTIQQFESIQDDLQLTRDHKRHIYLEPASGNPQSDTTSNRYFKYLVRLQGFDGNQASKIISPQHAGANIYVYSRDNQFFSSYAFSVTETVTVGANRSEYHIYRNGIVRVNDNIDLALLIDLDQNNSNTSRLYYNYYDSIANSDYPVINNTEICNLEFLMANKMKYKGKGMNLGPNYPNDFVESLNYNDTPTDGVSAGLVEVDISTGDVVVGPTNVPGNSGYGTIRYVKDKPLNGTGKKIFMVKMVTQEGTGEIWYLNNDIKIFRPTTDALYNPYRFLNNELNIDIRFSNTFRFYANPILAAGVIGAAIRFFGVNTDANFIDVQGFAYADGTSYPSKGHVNGLAFDISYKGTLFEIRNTLDLTENEAIVEDGSLLSALKFFGFNRFLVGLVGTSVYGTSVNYINELVDNFGATRFADHEDHIHADTFTPNN